MDHIEIQIEQFRSQNEWGEHPAYTQDEWRLEVRNKDTINGYWSWVYNRISNREDSNEPRT